MQSIDGVKETRRALVLYGVNDLRYETLPNYELEKDWVLVKIMACGICSSDEARIFKTGTYHFPTIPGHEMSGQIVAVNDEDAELLGKKTCIFPMLPCMQCEACQKEEYAQCADYNYFGSRCDGGFTDYLLVPKWNLVLFDDKIDYRVAALCEPSAVGLHAINIGEIKENENVAIVGTGTIGYLIALFAKDRKANVVMVGRNPESLKFAIENEIETMKFQEETNKKFDKVFEVVGSNKSINEAVRLANDFGTVILVGNPQEDVLLEKNLYWKILRKQLTIKGTWNSNYNSKINDWKSALKLMEKADIPFEKMITREFSLEDYQEAFKYFLDKNQKKLKVMFKNE